MFKCKKRHNHVIFVAIHDKVLYVDYSLDQVNKNKRCTKCCVKFSLATSSLCKCKDHATAIAKNREELVEGELLIDGIDSV